MEKKPGLVGCYLLIVLGEPLCEDHKERILQKVAKGLLSWDTKETDCDLKHMEDVCRKIISSKNSFAENDILVQHSTDKMAVEVLLNPQLFTLKQCLKNLLLAPTGHKHLIHAGYSFTGSGSWMLHDGIFKFQDFADAFEDKEVETFLQKMPRLVTFHVHCAPVGEWVTTNYQTQKFSKLANVQLNPADSSVGVQGAAALLDFFEVVLKSLNVESEMHTSQIVGNIRFNRPTLYVFPSGQGDCSLFGVTGFTMLIDGGFTPLPCFWNFVRHLERLDSIMVTRLNESNLWGVSSFFKKKVLQPIYPHIGYIFCNITEGKTSPTDEMHKDRNELLVSVIDVGQKMLGDLKNVGISPHQCLREPCITPLTLYHKVGHGTLDMFILSPPRESRILRDFLQQWSTNKESFSFVRTNSASQSGQDIAIPISHVMSICCLLIWKPAEPSENITRMLFPGSAPQSRIFEGLEKIKHLDVLCYPVCSRSSLRPAVVGKPQPKSSADVSYKAVPRFRSVSPLQRKIKSAKQASVESNKGDSSESLSSPLHKKLQQSKSATQPRKEISEDKKAIESIEKRSKTDEKAIKKAEKSAVHKSPVRKAKPKTTIKTVKKTEDVKKLPQKSAARDKEVKNKYVQEKDKDIDSLEEEKKDSEKESPEPSPKKQLFADSSKDDTDEVLQITMTEETSTEAADESLESHDIPSIEEEKKDSEKGSEKGSENTSPKKSILPEHLRDEIEPDSLESYDHDADGDISKDSLELSETDERRISSEKVDDIEHSTESSPTPTVTTCISADLRSEKLDTSVSSTIVSEDNKSEIADVITPAITSDETLKEDVKENISTQELDDTTNISADIIESSNDINEEPSIAESVDLIHDEQKKDEIDSAATAAESDVDIIKDEKAQPLETSKPASPSAETFERKVSIEKTDAEHIPDTTSEAEEHKDELESKEIEPERDIDTSKVEEIDENKDTSQPLETEERRVSIKTEDLEHLQETKDISEEIRRSSVNIEDQRKASVGDLALTSTTHQLSDEADQHIDAPIKDDDDIDSDKKQLSAVDTVREFQHISDISVNESLISDASSKKIEEEKEIESQEREISPEIAETQSKIDSTHELKTESKKDQDEIMLEKETESKERRISTDQSEKHLIDDNIPEFGDKNKQDQQSEIEEKEIHTEKDEIVRKVSVHEIDHQERKPSQTTEVIEKSITSLRDESELQSELEPLVSTSPADEEKESEAGGIESSTIMSDETLQKEQENISQPTVLDTSPVSPDGPAEVHQEKRDETVKVLQEVSESRRLSTDLPATETSHVASEIKTEKIQTSEHSMPTRDTQQTDESQDHEGDVNIRKESLKPSETDERRRSTDKVTGVQQSTESSLVPSETASISADISDEKQETGTVVTEDNKRKETETETHKITLDETFKEAAQENISTQELKSTSDVSGAKSADVTEERKHSIVEEVEVIQSKHHKEELESKVEVGRDIDTSEYKSQSPENVSRKTSVEKADVINLLETKDVSEDRKSAIDIDDQRNVSITDSALVSSTDQQSDEVDHHAEVLYKHDDNISDDQKHLPMKTEDVSESQTSHDKPVDEISKSEVSSKSIEEEKEIESKERRESTKIIDEKSEIEILPDFGGESKKIEDSKIEDKDKKHVDTDETLRKDSIHKTESHELVSAEKEKNIESSIEPSSTPTVTVSMASEQLSKELETSVSNTIVSEDNRSEITDVITHAITYEETLKEDAKENISTQDMTNISADTRKSITDTTEERKASIAEAVDLIHSEQKKDQIDSEAKSAERDADITKDEAQPLETSKPTSPPPGTFERKVSIEKAGVESLPDTTNAAHAEEHKHELKSKEDEPERDIDTSKVEVFDNKDTSQTPETTERRASRETVHLEHLKETGDVSVHAEEHKHELKSKEDETERDIDTSKVEVVENKDASQPFETSERRVSRETVRLEHLQETKDLSAQTEEHKHELKSKEDEPERDIDTSKVEVVENKDKTQPTETTERRASRETVHLEHLQETKDVSEEIRRSSVNIEDQRKASVGGSALTSITRELSDETDHHFEAPIKHDDEISGDEKHLSAVEIVRESQHMNDKSVNESLISDATSTTIAEIENKEPTKTIKEEKEIESHSREVSPEIAEEQPKIDTASEFRDKSEKDIDSSMLEKEIETESKRRISTDIPEKHLIDDNIPEFGDKNKQDQQSEIEEKEIHTEKDEIVRKVSVHEIDHQERKPSQATEVIEKSITSLRDESELQSELEPLVSTSPADEEKESEAGDIESSTIMSDETLQKEQENISQPTVLDTSPVSPDVSAEVHQEKRDETVKVLQEVSESRRFSTDLPATETSHVASETKTEKIQTSEHSMLTSDTQQTDESHDHDAAVNIRKESLKPSETDERRRSTDKVTGVQQSTESSLVPSETASISADIRDEKQETGTVVIEDNKSKVTETETHKITLDETFKEAAQENISTREELKSTSDISGAKSADVTEERKHSIVEKVEVIQSKHHKEELESQVELGRDIDTSEDKSQTAENITRKTSVEKADVINLLETKDVSEDRKSTIDIDDQHKVSITDSALVSSTDQQSDEVDHHAEVLYKHDDNISDDQKLLPMKTQDVCESQPLHDKSVDEISKSEVSSKSIEEEKEIESKERRASTKIIDEKSEIGFSMTETVEKKSEVDIVSDVSNKSEKIQDTKVQLGEKHSFEHEAVGQDSSPVLKGQSENDESEENHFSSGSVQEKEKYVKDNVVLGTNSSQKAEGQERKASAAEVIEKPILSSRGESELRSELQSSVSLTEDSKSKISETDSQRKMSIETTISASQANISTAVDTSHVGVEFKEKGDETVKVTLKEAVEETVSVETRKLSEALPASETSAITFEIQHQQQTLSGSDAQKPFDEDRFNYGDVNKDSSGLSGTDERRAVIEKVVIERSTESSPTPMTSADAGGRTQVTSVSSTFLSEDSDAGGGTQITSVSSTTVSEDSRRETADIITHTITSDEKLVEGAHESVSSRKESMEMSGISVDTSVDKAEERKSSIKESGAFIHTDQSRDDIGSEKVEFESKIDDSKDKSHSPGSGSRKVSIEKENKEHLRETRSVSEEIKRSSVDIVHQPQVSYADSALVSTTHQLSGEMDHHLEAHYTANDNISAEQKHLRETDIACKPQDVCDRSDNQTLESHVSTKSTEKEKEIEIKERKMSTEKLSLDITPDIKHQSKHVQHSKVEEKEQQFDKDEAFSRKSSHKEEHHEGKPPQISEVIEKSIISSRNESEVRSDIESSISSAIATEDSKAKTGGLVSQRIKSYETLEREQKENISQPTVLDTSHISVEIRKKDDETDKETLKEVVQETVSTETRRHSGGLSASEASAVTSASKELKDETGKGVCKELAKDTVLILSKKLSESLTPSEISKVASEMRIEKVQSSQQTPSASELRKQCYEDIIVKGTKKETESSALGKGGFFETIESEEDEEMIRHPTPPDDKDFYEKLGCAAGSAELTRLPSNDMPSVHLRRSSLMADEVLYEKPEDEDSTYSDGIGEKAGPDELHFGNTASAEYAEIINVSGGTTPSTTSEPQSPYDPKSISRGGSLKRNEHITVIKETQATESEPTPVGDTVKEYSDVTRERQMVVGERVEVIGQCLQTVVDEPPLIHGLSQTVETSSNVRSTTSVSSVELPVQSQASDEQVKKKLEEWGKPLGLPTLPETNSANRNASKTRASSAVRYSKTSVEPPRSLSTKQSSKYGKDATSDAQEKPVYLDLAYVPHHGDMHYCNADFFKKVRARFYVFSATNPSKEVFDALIDGKKCWENKEAEVTVIPTHETETLSLWMSAKHDLLEKYRIEVAPSASRCTVTLQDHETTCAAYRLEF